jgi:PilZ domain
LKPEIGTKPLGSDNYNEEEKRFALRMAVRIGIVVSGRAEDGSSWSEPTETDDISTAGALFHLNQKVTRGERLFLRAHKPDGTAIEATATVIRLAPAVYGTARVGVQIAEPADNWLRLFVSWVADEQPAPPPDLDSDDD